MKRKKKQDKLEMYVYQYDGEYKRVIGRDGGMHQIGVGSR